MAAEVAASSAMPAQVEASLATAPLSVRVATLATMPPSEITPESVARVLGLPPERWAIFEGGSQGDPFGGVRMPDRLLHGYSIALAYLDAAHSGMDFRIWWPSKTTEARPRTDCLDSAVVQSTLLAHHWQQTNFGPAFPEVALPEPREWISQLTLAARLVSIQYISTNPQDRSIGCVLRLGSARWFF
jgi:hypothetical protein